MWRCLECGRKFKSVRAAERAASDGCPHCGGVDVDFVPMQTAEDAHLQQVYEELTERE